MSWVHTVLGLLLFFFGSLFAVFAAAERQEHRLRDRLITILIASVVALAGLWLMLPSAAAVIDWLFGTTYSATVHRYQTPPETAHADVMSPRLMAALYAVITMMAAWGAVRARRGRLATLLSLVAANLLILAPHWTLVVDRVFATGIHGEALVTWVATRLWAPQGWLPTFLGCECLWVVALFIDRWSGLYVGSLSIFFAPFPLLIINECMDSSRRWWSRALFFIAGSVAGLGYNGMYQAEAGNEQVERNRRAKKLLAELSRATTAGEKVRPFCLYLRPFATTGRLDAQQRGSVEALDLESILERSLGPGLPLLALGRASEEPVLGARRVYVEDEHWREYFRRLAGAAVQIFVLPSAQGSTPEEISWLVASGNVRKSVFIMPETVTGEGWQATVNLPSTVHMSEGAGYDYRGYWDMAREGLAAELKLELPKYENDGALFCIDESRRVIAMARLGLQHTMFKALRVRRTLREIGGRWKP